MNKIPSKLWGWGGGSLNVDGLGIDRSKVLILIYLRY
jgi:hypothetical protein